MLPWRVRCQAAKQCNPNNPSWVQQSNIEMALPPTGQFLHPLYLLPMMDATKKILVRFFFKRSCCYVSSRQVATAGLKKLSKAIQVGATVCTLMHLHTASLTGPIARGRSKQNKRNITRGHKQHPPCHQRPKPSFVYETGQELRVPALPSGFF